MKLISLTLQGFKSFPYRSVLRFPRGISAIVGPNGCGKSNIVDAIKWVLGEQNPRFLRAKRMSDLLFSGDNGRPVHMADVRLLIEGGSDLLPPELADEPQIEIIRRLHSSGESEYRINGKICRLKDIQYIFMDTGAGSRTYSIVDQGHVGRFVEMDSQDRRLLIEEVAGISRYKIRRSEAQRRMAKTQDNLQRLDDLLHEINRQWENLAAQAEKTKRYLQLKNEQDSLHKSLLAHQWDNSVKLLEKFSIKRNEQEDYLNKIKQTLDEKKGNLDEFNWELNEIEDDMDQMRSSMAKAQMHLKDLRAKASESERRLDRILSKKRHLEEQISSLKHREAALKDQYQAMVREIASIKSQKTIQEKEVMISEAGVAEVEKIREAILTSMEETKVNLVDISAKYARVEGEKQKSVERTQQLIHLIRKKTEEKDRISKELSDISTKIQLLTKELQENSAKNSDLLNRIDIQKQELEKLKTARENIRQDLSNLNSSLSAARARYDLLKRMEHSGLGYSQATKALLSSNIATRGTLADFLEVEEGREVLIETALGEMLQAVLLDAGVSVSDVLAYLKQKGLNRARIIPLAHDFPVRYKSRPQDDCVCLLSFISVPEFLNSILNEVLGNWFLVEDIQKALDLRNHFKKSSFLITRRGEVLTPWGEIEIRGNEAEDQGILKRRADLRKLSVSIENIEGGIANLSARKNGLDDKITSIRQELNELVSESETVRERGQKLERDLDRQKVRKSGLEERKEILGFEIDQMNQEKDALEDVAAGLKGQLEKILTDKAEIESKLKGRGEALRTQEAVLKRRRNVLEQNRMELTRLETTLSSRENDLLKLEKRRERASKEISATLRHTMSMEPDISKTERELSEARAKVEAQEAALSRANSNLLNLQEKHRLIRDKKSELREEIELLDENYRKGEEKIQKTDLQLFKLRQAMDQIKTVFSQKYREDITRSHTKWMQKGFSPGKAKSRIAYLQHEIDRTGPVNLTALEEFDELDQRREYLQKQRQDITVSIQDLERAIKKINTESRERFREALEKINQQLSQIFPLLFNGGSAELVVEKGQDALSAGVDYMVRLPGKHIQHLGLLSGGEKAMAALALIFAIYLIKPSPFCLLDEVDAPLDHTNTARFNKLIKKMAERSQIVLITHNQKVMEVADSLYGVTMEKKGISKLVNIDLVD